MSSIPYAATRDGQMFALGVCYTAALIQHAFLVPDFSPKAKAPSKPRKPRKPKSRVFVADLPLSNQPPAACAARTADRSNVSVTERAVLVPSVTSLPQVAPFGQPGSLTPSQVRCLEQAEAFGIATATAERTLADFRSREARKALRQKVKAVLR